jgi:hypothetical protein
LVSKGLKSAVEPCSPWCFASGCRVGKQGNKTLKIYHPKVSQFGPSDPKWFLQQPAFSRDYPPLES